MKLPAALVLVLVAGCPKERPAPRGGGGSDAVAAAPIDAAAPRGFAAASTPLVTPALAAATLDWDHPVVTRMELEDGLEDGDEAIAATRARLGRFVVSFKHGSFDAYDAAAGTLTFRAHGLEGMDLDPPVVFDGDPDIMVGSLPGPAGGSVRLRVSDLLCMMTIDAVGAAAVVAAEASDPIMTQYLLELGDIGQFDDATYVNAKLLGVRFVRLGAREVLLEGTPVTPPPKAP